MSRSFADTLENTKYVARPIGLRRIIPFVGTRYPYFVGDTIYFKVILDRGEGAREFKELTFIERIPGHSDNGFRLGDKKI